MARLRTKTRHVIYGAAAGTCVSALLLGGLLVQTEMRQAKEKNRLEQQYSAEIAQFKQQTKATLTKGWVPSREIAAGQKILEDDLEPVELPKTSVPGNFIATKDRITGRTAKVELGANTLITESLLYEEEATPGDLRNREMSFVQLPNSLGKGDVMDIRIQFPTGEDYILLSKKKVNDLKKPTLTVTLDEHEILMLSSAIVDAYLHKASIYALTYVEPGLQAKAIPTYPANQQVMKLLGRDPNLAVKAENYLNSQASRDLLEQSLNTVSEQSALSFAGSQAEAAAAAAEAGASLNGREEEEGGPPWNAPQTELVGN
ncbi:SAF domain-containing protein [Paenibacillus yonginensis]|uniref:SAF domain-containing protein n=1 Tax=Paenibacillus yonginensis TaxID=1462996 RepID=UPI0008388A42|nr:SAF domain-containing protein [Paenibacillus yonginensis]